MPERRRERVVTVSEATPVRALREARKLSLRQLEELTGINRGVWSQIENGKHLPEPRHIAALSRALGVPAGQWRIRFVLELEEGGRG